MEIRSEKKAIIYARVSSPKQVRKGHGLEAQEMRCREHARYRGYEVVQVFKDEGVSGSLKDRPNIKALITYLKRNRKRGPFVVIIDEISRLARDIRAHLDLKDAILGAGAELESPGIEFGTDANGILFEQTQAIFAEHHRRKNREQVISRMQARVMSGYYCFAPVPGYKYAEVPGHGKMLVPEPQDAPIVKEGMEGFASGRFQTMTEVKRFMDRYPLSFVKTKSGKVRLQQVKEILDRPLYAGYINVKKWDVYMHQGKHEPLISLETWNRIRERMNGVTNAPAKKNISEDFPLRGFVACSECEKPLCASWSRGRSARYPYYHCINKHCSQHNKTIKRDKVEGDFAELLTTMTPSKRVFDLCLDMFRSLWGKRLEQTQVARQSWKKEISDIEKKTDGLLQRIVDTDSPTLISAYEKKIKELEMKRLTLQENAENKLKPQTDPMEVFRTAMSFLSNPCKLWTSDMFEHRRLVLRLAFSGPIPYSRNEGFRTAEISSPIRLLGVFDTSKFGVVGPEGLEPPTRPL